MKVNNKAQGAVAVEYLIGLIFIVIVLLIPIPSQGGKNALQLLADAIKQVTTYTLARRSFFGRARRVNEAWDAINGRA